MATAGVVSSVTRFGLTEPFDLQVARGQVVGHSTVNIYGANAALVGTTYSTLWSGGAAYAFPASAAKMNLASSVNSGADLTATVTIQGLDASYNMISETLTLNGTTAVETTKSYLRVNGMFVASGVPTGVITLKDLTNTTTYGYIAAGGGRMQVSIYTVPAGYTLYLSRIDAYTSLNGAAADYAVYRNYTTSSTGVVNITQQAPFTNTYHAQRVMPRPFPEKTDIQLQVRGSGAGTTQFVSVAGEGYLVKNAYDVGGS